MKKNKGGVPPKHMFILHPFVIREMHVSGFVFVLWDTAEEGFKGVQGCEFDAGCWCLGVGRLREGIVVMERGGLIDVCECECAVLGKHEGWPELGC